MRNRNPIVGPRPGIPVSERVVQDFRFQCDCHKFFFRYNASLADEADPIAGLDQPHFIKSSGGFVV